MSEVTSIQKTMCDILGVEPGEIFRYIRYDGKVSLKSLEVTKFGTVTTAGYHSDDLKLSILCDLINHPQYIVRADGTHPPMPDYKLDENFLPIPRICEILGVRRGEFFEIRDKYGKSAEQMINAWGHFAIAPYHYYQCVETFDRERYTLHQGAPRDVTQKDALESVQAILEHKFTDECRYSPPDFVMTWLRHAVKDNSVFTKTQVGVLTHTLYLGEKLREKVKYSEWSYNFRRLHSYAAPDELESCVNKIIYENATPKECEQMMTEAKIEINEYVKANAGNIKGQHIMALMSETDNPNWDDVFSVRREIHQLDRCRFTERELCRDKEQPNKNDMVR